jgi:hypothetical protein
MVYVRWWLIFYSLVVLFITSGFLNGPEFKCLGYSNSDHLKTGQIGLARYLDPAVYGTN